MFKTMITAVAFSAVAGIAMADPVEGVWQTEVDDGAYAHVTIAPCGAAFCGTITRAYNDSGQYKSANDGKQLVWDMVAKGGGNYGDGKIWQPSTGKTYNSKMALSGNRLKVSGCVGPICKKQTWSRVQ